MFPSPLLQTPSPRFAPLWRHAGKSWPRDLQALALLGVTGWSSRLSLNAWLAAHDPASRSPQDRLWRRLWSRMQARSLVVQHRVVLDRRRRLWADLLWLTRLGREFLWAQGLPCLMLSEWQRLCLRHEGERQPLHSATVILAAHCFRQHGFHTEVCPPLPGSFAPDLRLSAPTTAQTFFVEVETPARGGKAQRRRLRHKWRLMGQAQGFVALCALHPPLRGQRMRSAQQVASRGLATDLLTLMTQPHALWPRRWGWEEEPQDMNHCGSSLLIYPN